MDTKITNTPNGGDEVPCVTEASLGFVPVLRATFNLIIAERDLEKVSYNQNPNYHSWLRDAELAQEHLTDAMRDFFCIKITHPADRPLARAVLLLDAVIGTEEPGGGRRLARQMQGSFFSRFQARGIDATALHRNGLLIQARHLMTALVALPLFDACIEASVASAPEVSGNDLLSVF